MKTMDELRSRMARHQILQKNYTISRADLMNSNVQKWRERREYAHTVIERNFCNQMIQMYFARYSYYVKESAKDRQPLSVEELIKIKESLNAHNHES